MSTLLRAGVFYEGHMSDDDDWNEIKKLPSNEWHDFRSLVWLPTEKSKPKHKSPEFWRNALNCPIVQPGQVTIWLDAGDIARVKARAEAMNNYSIARRDKETRGAAGNFLEWHTTGALGERALVKYCNKDWGRVGSYSPRDIGNSDIKTRIKSIREILLNPDSKKWRDDISYVLGMAYRFDVFDLKPNHLILGGWIYGHEAKEVGIIRNPGNRHPALFVNVKYLHPMSNLP